MSTLQKTLTDNIFKQLLYDNCCRSLVKVETKKHVLQDVSKLFSDNLLDISTGTILEALVTRENLGCTCIGDDIALPHARIANIEHPYLALMTLAKPIEFDHLDRQFVDIVCALLVPENAVEEHLDILSQLATLFKNSDFCSALRGAKDDAELYHIATRYG